MEEIIVEDARTLRGVLGELLKVCYKSGGIQYSERVEPMEYPAFFSCGNGVLQMIGGWEQNGRWVSSSYTIPARGNFEGWGYCKKLRAAIPSGKTRVHVRKAEEGSGCFPWDWVVSSGNAERCVGFPYYVGREEAGMPVSVPRGNLLKRLKGPELSRMTGNLGFAAVPGEHRLGWDTLDREDYIGKGRMLLSGSAAVGTDGFRIHLAPLPLSVSSPVIVPSRVGVALRGVGRVRGEVSVYQSKRGMSFVGEDWWVYAESRKESEWVGDYAYRWASRWREFALPWEAYPAQGEVICTELKGTASENQERPVVLKLTERRLGVTVVDGTPEISGRLTKGKEEKRTLLSADFTEGTPAGRMGDVCRIGIGRTEPPEEVAPVRFDYPEGCTAWIMPIRE